MSSEIPVRKALLIALVAVASLALLAVAYLLGRETGRSGQPPLPTAAVPAPAITAAPTTNSPLDSPAGTDLATNPINNLTAPSPSPAPSPAPAISPVNDPLRAAVAGYFRAARALQPEASGDPEATAQGIVAGIAKGDSSGMDGMLKQAQATRERMAALQPPPPCVGYHRESLACLDAGLDLMRRMQRALTSGDASAAAVDIAQRANALKARTEALQGQERALRQRYPD